MTTTVFYPVAVTGITGGDATPWTYLQAADGQLFTNGSGSGTQRVLYDFSAIQGQNGTPIIDSARLQARWGDGAGVTYNPLDLLVLRLRTDSLLNSVGDAYQPAASPRGIQYQDFAIPGPITAAQIRNYWYAEIGASPHGYYDYVRVEVNWHVPDSPPVTPPVTATVPRVTATKEIQTIGPLRAGGHVDTYLDVINEAGTAVSAIDVHIEDVLSELGALATRTFVRSLPLGGAVTGASAAETSGTGIDQVLTIPPGVMVRYAIRDRLNSAIPDATVYKNIATVTCPSDNLYGVTLSPTTEDRLVYRAPDSPDYGEVVADIGLPSFGSPEIATFDYTVPASNGNTRFDVKRVQVIITGSVRLVLVAGNKIEAILAPSFTNKDDPALIALDTPPVKFYGGGTGTGEHVTGGSFFWMEYINVDPGDILHGHLTLSASGNFIDHPDNEIKVYPFTVQFFPLEA